MCVQETQILVIPTIILGNYGIAAILGWDLPLHHHVPVVAGAAKEAALPHKPPASAALRIRRCGGTHGVQHAAEER